MKMPFVINIEQFELDILKDRLAATRWPMEIENQDWAAGTNLAYIRELCNYWQNEFDWRKQEAYLNSFSHFTANVNGTRLHFIHEKGKGKKAMPLLLTHGWPDSFVRFLKLIPLLTEPDENGFCFDVIVPSIPGYAFSEIPATAGMTPQLVADLFARLVTEELGYDRFLAHGGDWGSSITEAIAYQYPEKLLGMHLADIPYYHLFTVPPDELSDAEKKYLETGKKWQMTEGGYAMIQSTKPQTLGYGLNDSPSGLASWIIEKFFRWSDNGGDLERCFTMDELLTNLTIYWVTQTILSSIRIYYEAGKSKKSDKPAPKLKVPTAGAIFPKDLVPAPRDFAERIYNIRQWTEMPRGGHFAAMEQPELLAEDIRKFAKLL